MYIYIYLFVIFIHINCIHIIRSCLSQVHHVDRVHKTRRWHGPLVSLKLVWEMSQFVPVEVRRAKLHLVDLVRSSDGGQIFLVRVESWEIRKIIVGETTSNIFAKCKVLWGKQLGKYRCCEKFQPFWGPFRQTSSQPLFCGQLFQCWQWLWNAIPQTGSEAGSERISKSGARHLRLCWQNTSCQLPASTDS